MPLCVDDVFNERWSYAAAKIHGEVLVINACRQFGVPFSIIRYHNVYGPRMGDKHVVPDFLIRLRQGVAELHGHEDTRAFLYIDDAVEATRLVGTSDSTAGQVINVGGEAGADDSGTGPPDHVAGRSRSRRNRAASFAAGQRQTPACRRSTSSND